MANPNPSADQAIRECLLPFKLGAGQFPPTSASEQWILAHFTPFFKARLGGDPPERLWENDRGKVMQVAYFYGSLSAFFAFAAGDKEVTPGHLEQSTPFIADNCTIALKKPARNGNPFVYCS